MLDAELYRRVAELEKKVQVLLDLHIEARELLRPRDAMAICDQKGILGPGPHEPKMVQYYFTGDMAKTVIR